MRGTGLKVVLCATLLLSAAPRDSIAAQSAEIRGRIVDEQRRPVAGAMVTVANPRTGLSRSAASDGEGIYRVAGLPAGVYDVRASLDGFTTVEQRGTIVEVGAVLHLDLSVRIASVLETVDIVAPSPLIQTSSPVIGGRRHEWGVGCRSHAATTAVER